MAVVYNYYPNQTRFQTLKIQNSSPKSAKHVQSPKELKKKKHR